MLVQFSIVPLGKGESVSEQISKVLKIVDERGLPSGSLPWERLSRASGMR